MKKRYIGKDSASLASGIVVFPGSDVDLPAKEWAANEHLAEHFVDLDEKPSGKKNKEQ